MTEKELDKKIKDSVNKFLANIDKSNKDTYDRYKNYECPDIFEHVKTNTEYELKKIINACVEKTVYMVAMGVIEGYEKMFEVKFSAEQINIVLKHVMSSRYRQQGIRIATENLCSFLVDIKKTFE